MIRMSVSWLDGWRYCKAIEGRTFADFMADVRKESAPTPKMEAGAAFAKLLEHAEYQQLERVRVGDWDFDFTELEADLTLPRLREIKGEFLIQTPSGPVTLVGKVDAIYGRTIRDVKLSETIDAEKYVDSLQWRAYLLMFHADTFIYDVFKRSAENGSKRIKVTEYQAFPFYRYPAMEEDVRRAVCELAELFTRHAPGMVTP